MDAVEQNRMESGFIYGTVASIEPVGNGLRACVDFVDYLEADEGLLVGNTGHGYLLVLAETRATETYPARAFRVNCGAIHQYVKQGEKTAYLSELTSGAKLKVYSPAGSRDIAVGRVKLERRAFIRLEIRTETGHLSATLQASDSVFVWTNGQAAKPLMQLVQGDQVLCMPDAPGRHLGERIETATMER